LKKAPPYLYKKGTANVFYKPGVGNKNESFLGLLAPNDTIVKLQGIPCPTLNLGVGPDSTRDSVSGDG